ncbi:hypothetical protein cypCar_00001561 [Cyprinus carpio]|nr:hypothetical protein cypCar_00001561 [Cyprinus carpio]
MVVMSDKPLICHSVLSLNTGVPFKGRFPVSTEEATPEMEEQSGEGSGNSDPFAPFISMHQKLTRKIRSPEQEVNKNEEEGSTEFSGDIDYSEYITPQKVDWLSKEDLKEENIIA